MKCSEVQDWIPQYLADDLEELSIQKALETHFAECLCCREELVACRDISLKLREFPEQHPSSSLLPRFEAMLAAYQRGLQLAYSKQGSSQGIIGWIEKWWPRQMAVQWVCAAILFGLGIWIGTNQRSELAKDPAIAQLREELSSVRQMVTVSLLQQPSASERLRGVEWSYHLDRPEHSVLGALLQALDSDPNVNVRLAAIDALQQFASDSSVRKGMVESLARQNAPLIQMKMIQVLVGIDEKTCVPVLKQLIENPEANKDVKDQARLALQQLG